MTATMPRAALDVVLERAAETLWASRAGRAEGRADGLPRGVAGLPNALPLATSLVQIIDI
jgi:hypothetical protein